MDAVQDLPDDATGVAVGMWARVLGYAAGVLGAACLWLLLGSSPAAADEAPTPTERGALGALTDEVTDSVSGTVSRTVRDTVDTAARPVREVAPAPAKPVVDAATTTVDQVATSVDEVVEQPVRDTVEDTVAAVAAHPEAPADPAPEPAPEPAPHQVQPPAQVEHQLPERSSDPVRHRSVHDRRAATDAPTTPAPGPTAGLVTAPSPDGSGPAAEESAPAAPVLPVDDVASPDAAGTSGSSGPGAAADAADRVVLPGPEGLAPLSPARCRAVVPLASSPGFSPD